MQTFSLLLFSSLFCLLFLLIIAQENEWGDVLVLSRSSW